jgi:hypothetical protein
MQDVVAVHIFPNYISLWRLRLVQKIKLGGYAWKRVSRGYKEKIPKSTVISPNSCINLVRLIFYGALKIY